MPNLLDETSVSDPISDEDWTMGDSGTAVQSQGMLLSSSTEVQRFVFPFLRGRLQIESGVLLPDWFREAIWSLDELACLPDNWDSYGAYRIRHSSILSAVELLLSILRDGTPAPSVIPTNRGTVMLEWHTNGIDLEVEVRGPGRLHVAFEDSLEGIAWEADIGSNLEKLVECVRRLSETDRVSQ